MQTVENDQQTNKQTNDKTDIIEYLKIGNQGYYEHKIIAEEFAKHFSNVGKQYAEHIPSSKKGYKTLLGTNTRQSKINFHEPS